MSRYRPLIVVAAIMLYLLVFLGVGGYLRAASTCDQVQHQHQRLTYLDGMVCRYLDTHEAITPLSTRN
ncbi:TPA: hypothetical protein ACS72N_000159 [Providencia alcalifaciens]